MSDYDQPERIDLVDSWYQLAGRSDVRLTPAGLAADIHRDATPDFKVALVRNLFRLDPALEAEVIYPDTADVIRRSGFGWHYEKNAPVPDPGKQIIK